MLNLKLYTKLKIIHLTLCMFLPPGIGTSAILLMGPQGSSGAPPTLPYPPPPSPPLPPPPPSPPRVYLYIY